MALKELLSVLAAEVDTVATRTCKGMVSKSHRGLILLVDITNLASSPTFTPLLQVRRGASWVTIWTAAAALSANGLAAYLLYPGTAAANYTEYEDMVLPMEYRIGLTYAGNGTTDNADTAVSVEHLP